MNAIHAGQIKGMYIEGENPAMSDPDLQHARQALAMLDHLVVQDLFVTETAFHADVILPASAFAEKEGSFTNTDRRVQLARQVIKPPGDARQDLWIIQEIGKRMGLPWNYDGPADVFAEMTQVMPSLKNIRSEHAARRRTAGSLDHPRDRQAHGSAMELRRSRRCLRRDDAGDAVAEEHQIGTRRPATHGRISGSSKRSASAWVCHGITTVPPMSSPR